MSESQILFVARGKTVMLDGIANGPGAMVTLSLADATFLLSRNFVQAEPPALTPLAAPNPSGIGLQNPIVDVQGPQYRR
jgi:hypothetical protein